MTLKTSDKAEAERSATSLELELDMVAIAALKKLDRPDTTKLQVVFREALE
ncbi:hypothetical protein [Roseibium sp.]|uniref:hypothetical protein n=1 Tax=Roseibium sp. TaxID=1936156 RepID=UPI00329696BB